MSDDQTRLPPALRAALPLLRVRPNPRQRDGYLDLLAGNHNAVEPGNVLQRLWQTGIGSMVYDNVAAVARTVLARVTPSLRSLVPPEGTALDVGCGPGNITAELGRIVGPDGLALGVDVSEPMLRRAVGLASDQIGFLRADARDLPLHDETVDAVTCLAVLQLIPEPFTVLDEIARVLRPSGRLLVMVPTVRFGPLDGLARWLGAPGGVRLFGPTEIAQALTDRDFNEPRVTGFGPVQWVSAQRGW